MKHPILDFFHTLHQTAHIAHHVGEKMIFSGEQLTGVQFQILHSLERLGGSTGSMGELMVHKSCTPANLTRIINLLEKSGMVTRTPDKGDRRKTLLQITKKGEKSIQLIKKKMNQKATELAHLGEGIDFDKMSQDLQKVQKLLRKHTHD